jgi:hypothetical protein
MTLLRYAAFLALAVWIGGLVALAGLAAPVAFEVLGQLEPGRGTVLAGHVFGVMFLRFQYIAWGAALVLLASLSFRAALGPRPRRTAIRIWTIAIMAAISVFIVVVVVPQIEAIRASVNGAVAALAATDARRVAMGRWHQASAALSLLTLAGALGLAWAEIKDQH